jgi:hypothetical protein
MSRDTGQLFEIVFAVHVLLFSHANKIKGCAYHMDIAVVGWLAEDFGLV